MGEGFFRRAGFGRPGRITLVIGLIGVAITALVCLTAFSGDRNNERRLLKVQARQAAEVIGSAILGITNPLQTALQVASVTQGSRAEFTSYMAAYTGPGRLFVSSSLWRLDSSGKLELVGAAGSPPDLKVTTPSAQQFLARALHSTTFSVIGIPSGDRLGRIGYAVAGRTTPRLVVYAERAIPANREVPVESDSAFADLDYATYLGSTLDPADLATTDVAPDTLPLGGYTVRDSIPFGDSTLTLVAGARGSLGGALGAELPWIFLVGGLLLTAASALVAEQLVARRIEAEANAKTVSELYERVDEMYAEQRTIAVTLQNALLPRSNPSIRNVEIGTRYVAGADGVDIGGDWFSVVALDERRFAFVIGDVSGRGIEAASVMARLRFTIRAYLLEGHAPSVVLEMCSRQIDIESDGHFATALVGVGDAETGELTFASAGHLAPLVVADGRAWLLEIEAGLPLGYAAGSYPATLFSLPPGATLLAYTDGLVERRGEGIERGLQRLTDAAAVSGSGPTVDAMLAGLLASLVPSGASDDVAVLALRRLDTDGQAQV